MSEIELKACPFCGADRETLAIEHMEGTILHPAHCVRCDNCGASSRYTDHDCREVWNERAPQWQPISSAPKDGRPLLLDHPDWHLRVMRGGWDAHELAWRVHGFGCPATQPNKWQPLPAPPEVSDGQ